MHSLLFCRGAALDTSQIPNLLYNQLVEQNQSMFELEYLLAFGLGAGLVALTPVVAAAAGKESSITKTVSGAGRGLTKQGLKAGLFVGGKVSGLFTGVKSGLNEVGESFGDILAEAKADMATPKTKTSSQKA